MGVVAQQLISSALYLASGVLLLVIGIRLNRWISARDTLRKDVDQNTRDIQAEHRALNQLARILGVEQSAFRD